MSYLCGIGKTKNIRNMVTSVRIENNKNLPLGYVQYLHEDKGINTFDNGKEYFFKPGINIIIGKNGCGKSTLIKLMSKYLLCSESMYSKLPNDILVIGNLFESNSNKLIDGMKIGCDYAGVVYNYITNHESSESKIMSSIFDFSLYVDNNVISTGEQMKNTLGCLFQLAFKNNDIQFPIQKIKNAIEHANDVWAERLKQLLNYYKENRIKINQDDFEFTFLLDEPDRNLDVENIEELYEILSYKKERTQLICVIHNPILIYKLSKLDYINFVELTDGYLEQVKSVFNNL